ncbi:Plant invertase/pectin methylesterase inhibitor superfamily [Spatholobus suberectus]|nr:Plant invertase/pectin methylesterase inhibitor superfamily [Spatholobus suberectus]
MGGVRCSVKPASRSALHSKNQETCAFAQVPYLRQCLLKRRWSKQLSSPGHCALWLQQPVIPPLLGVGGVRCSVKPASRGALHSKTQETCALAQGPWINSQLGPGRPA